MTASNQTIKAIQEDEDIIITQEFDYNFFRVLDSNEMAKYVELLATKPQSERVKMIYNNYSTQLQLLILKEKLNQLYEEINHEINRINQSSLSDLQYLKEQLKKKLADLKMNHSFLEKQEFIRIREELSGKLADTIKAISEHLKVSSLETRIKKINQIQRDTEAILAYFERKLGQYLMLIKEGSEIRRKLQFTIPEIISPEEYKMHAEPRKKSFQQLFRIEEAESRYHTPGIGNLKKDETFLSRMKAFYGVNFESELGIAYQAYKPTYSKEEYQMTLWHMPLPSSEQYEAVQFLESPVHRQTKISLNTHLDENLSRSVYEQQPQFAQIVNYILNTELARFLSLPGTNIRKQHEEGLRKLIENPYLAINTSAYVPNSEPMQNISQLAAILYDLLNNNIDEFKNRIFGLAINRIEQKPKGREARIDQTGRDIFYSGFTNFRDALPRKRVSIGQVKAIEDEMKCIIAEIMPFLSKYFSTIEDKKAAAIVHEINSLSPNYIIYSSKDGPMLINDVENKGSRSIINQISHEHFVKNRKQKETLQRSISILQGKINNIDSSLTEKTIAAFEDYGKYKISLDQLEHIQLEIDDSQEEITKLSSRIMQIITVMKEMNVKTDYKQLEHFKKQHHPSSSDMEKNIQLIQLMIDALLQKKESASTVMKRLVGLEDEIELDKKISELQQMISQIRQIQEKMKEMEKAKVSRNKTISLTRVKILENIEDIENLIKDRDNIDPIAGVYIPPLATIPVQLPEYLFQIIELQMPINKKDPENIHTLENSMQLLFQIGKEIL
jgi:hypothetical protein